MEWPLSNAWLCDWPWHRTFDWTRDLESNRTLSSLKRDVSSVRGTSQGKGSYRQLPDNACSANGRVLPSRSELLVSDCCDIFIQACMSTEIRNWDVVAKAMEAAGATSSQMYLRAKALAEGKLDPMPTSWPEAPYSISAVAG